jgi:predicted ABC-type ATPase
MSTLRLRVFAGPNGSGKSTVIKSVREYKQGRKRIDFGIYINADDIASDLRKGVFDFSTYSLKVSLKELVSIVDSSGLLNEQYDEQKFKSSFSLKENKILLKDKGTDERLAQILADFLRKRLIAEKKKVSFETVFSHKGKLDIMRQAVDAGYKVYLYFVSTESPGINISRVALRKAKGGHDVPSDKIESRYYRSLDLLFDAAQISYQAFFYDNSGQQPNMFAHFKVEGDGKKWDDINKDDVPLWFKQYYSGKAK